MRIIKIEYIKREEAFNLHHNNNLKKKKPEFSCFVFTRNYWVFFSSSLICLNFLFFKLKKETRSILILTL